VIHYERTANEILASVGARARELRLLRKLRQADLASRAGVGLATVHRFERTGTASLETVLAIASALGVEGGFEHLFEAPPFASLDDALERPALAARRRAPRRK
jgi:transcriptional regulator with XRE-family HTH domain